MNTETNTAAATPVNTNSREVFATFGDEEKAFRTFLDDNMSGQDDVKDALVDILTEIRNPLRNPEAPIFSVLMCGPSTSGKTLGFKLLVQWVHGNKERMMFFTGSEFEEKHQIQKLIGAPHGYIGYVDVHDAKYVAPKPGESDDSAMLAQHNLNNSRIGSNEDVVFILFDEWEKFHFSFNKFMLNPLREGRGKLNNGQPVNFRNCVIGFTSNLGSDEIEKMENPIGFRVADAKAVTKDNVRQVVVRELVKGYPPEFRNRINRILFFTGLDDSQLLRVVDLELKTVESRVLSLGSKAFILSVDDNAKKWLLVRDGTSDEKSPLPGMQQKMTQHLVSPLGRMVNSGAIVGGDRVEVTHKEGDNKLTFIVTPDPLAAALAKAGVSPQEPQPVEQKVDQATVGAASEAAGAAPNNGGMPTTALVIFAAPGMGFGSDDTTGGASSEGIEVRHPQPFQLVMPAKPAQVERVVTAVLSTANQMPHTQVTGYSVNLVEGRGTAEVYSTIEDMVALKSAFPGLKVIIVGGELAD